MWIRPSNYPVTDIVTGSGTYTYDVIFKGINTLLGSVQDSFVVSSSVSKTVGQNFLRAPKRVYAGARNTNLTGANLQPCDVLISSVKYWTKYLEDYDLEQHLFDINNSGISGSYKNISALDSNNNNNDLLNYQMLALDWDFDSVTGSSAAGKFYVQDVSSGSAEIRDNFGWLGNFAGYQHTGYGSNFAASSTNVIKKQNANSFKFVDPESPVSSEMISILSDDDKVYGLPLSQTVPDFYRVVEKSIYNAISEEMLTFFAGVIDYNNLIGEPVNRYRERYKTIEKLREIFFRRVTKVTDVENYINYYKWFDDSLSEIISQLIPASSGFVPDVLNVIESHVLERNKYKSQFPTIEHKETTEGVAYGIREATYNWRLNHHPISGLQRENSQWWRERAIRQNNTVFSSDDSDINIERDVIRDSSENLNNHTAAYFSTTTNTVYKGSTFAIRNLATPYKIKINKNRTIKGGVNFTDNKNIHFTYNAINTDGPVSIIGSSVIPENVLVFFVKDIVELKDIADITTPPARKKTKRVFKLQHGRDWDESLGFSTVKTSYALPFNIISASENNPTTGYNKEVVNKITGGIQITNLHNDVYGLDMEIPMQGPFSDFVVGGHQSRHIAINTGSDDYTTRPEGWKLLLGTITASTPDVTGALGMVGPDYPWPNTLDPVGQRAPYYRDFIAKRPVNIRNIKSTSGSINSVLGNYRNNWEVVNTVGAFLNPRHFIKNQPTLPTQITQTPSASQARSILDIRRTDGEHFGFVPDYSVAYLTGATNKTVIIGRFGAPGGIEVMGKGYQDIRAAELSVYNVIPYRNLTVIKPSQGPSGSTSEATGSGTTGIRVSDIHGKDFGLRAHLARHAGRFGRDSLLVSAPGASYVESPAFHKVQRNTRTVIKITNSGDLFNSDTVATAQSSQYDNFFVQHQIPRADRQYAWVTGALASNSTDIRYYGMAPVFGPQAGLYSSSADGYVAYFNYVSASDITGTTTPTLYQPTQRLNIFTVDPVDAIAAAPNTLGNTSATANSSYINTDLLTKAGINTEINSDVNYFNLLMTRRGNTFGWNWSSARNGDHPILVRHRNNNTITVQNQNKNMIESYGCSPVSMRGRPAHINLDIDGNNITAKVTHNNEFIFFNETALNDLQYPVIPRIITPLEQLIKMGRNKPSYKLNWVLYSENVFPSSRNEFLSRSLQRTGYDNKFWRDSATERVNIGTGSTNSFNVSVSQSSWPLDAQEDFVTRTAPATIDVAGGTFAELVSEGKAGELQNNYIFAHTGAGATGLTPVKSIRPGGLYSRKHFLSSPQSVVSPSGVKIAETGSLSSIFVHSIQSYGGEAKWEADSQAGIIVKSDSTAVFEPSASSPWFNSYSDFRADLKLMAKDYSIVPEFRISEHIEDYAKFGIANRNKFDTFEIPGTTVSSSADSFYKDYSNSEFMTNFLKIKDDTLLGAKEIRLVCSAAIRFNPYKGFYPAQRTLDLITQFSKSYASSFVANRAGTIVQNNDGHLRPLIQTLFAPGLLYNSIKSGIAVDYPIVTEPTKIRRDFFGNSSDTDNWMITTANTGSTVTGEGYKGGEYWDYRIPFEALTEPEKYLNGLEFYDMEPHPSATLNVTAAWTGQAEDNLYSLMADNFFGEVASFFLKDGGFTKLESEIVTNDLTFISGGVYGARLKMRPSTFGPCTYQHESGSAEDNTAYTKFGGRLFTGSSFSTGSFPLPQFPRQNPDFKESFTMYSRPSAFGPPLAGRPTGSLAVNAGVTASVPIDGLSGFNGAYTPPYYNGEAWIDFIFRPQATTTYDLEKILSETKAVFWRMDPGVSASAGVTNKGTQLIRTYSGSSIFAGLGDLVYEGKNINYNVMQLSASINYLGVERVQRQRKDKFNNEILSENETVGKKWVIQPKFETPMLNFNDGGIHPITNAGSTLTVPTFASASVPRGMWHQFGVIPETPDKGIFLEIGEIPKNWLKSHYDVIVNNSTYNDNNASANGANLYKEMHCLTKVIKFKPKKGKARLGEIATQKTIREAIVAVPYVLNDINSFEISGASGIHSQERKQFITIPEERIRAAKKESFGSLEGDSLDASGESIRKLLQKMERYVLPPQFDFLNNEDIDPIAMYIFEFEYKFDRDDLSYIWQNLAPRDYKKITLTSESIAHSLDNTELLSSENLMNNENLRWMVFKIKQRAQTKYSDIVTPQIGQSSNGEIFDFAKTENEYDVSYNWPYDYLSFIELIKIDAEVLYKNDESEDETE